MTPLWFVLAAAVGTALRVAVSRRFDLGLPWGTLAVNLAASFVLGLVADAGEATRTVLGVGLLGALSTWSGLINHTAVLLRAGRRPAAGAYLGSTVVLGVAAAGLGLAVGG